MTGKQNEPLAKNALGRWRLPYVRIACRKCPRFGQYHTAKLIARYGVDITIPMLMSHLVKCDRRTFSDYCRAYPINEDENGRKALPELARAYEALLAELEHENRARRKRR
jgi:hypothetical protein